MSGGRTHLAAALRWTGSADGPGRAAVLGAMLGTGGPAALAAVAGDLGPGMAAALGGLMIGGVPVGDGAAAQVRAILGRLVPAVAATITVAVLARDGGWADAVLVALAGGAALVGGISRPLAAATTRFVLFLIIAAALPGTDPGRSGVTLLILAGAVWGDHCSPISDTTILSSLASGCDHIEHVRTQLPYAMTVGGVAILLGSIMTALGSPWWIGMSLGLLVLWLILRFIGKPSYALQAG